MRHVEVVTDLDEEAGRALWPVYDAAFGDISSYDAWWSATLAPHAAREGFRMAVAREDDEVVGFSYGYTGRAGQWWTDRAATALGPQLAAAWLGGHFELVELAVAPRMRRRGLGAELLDRVTADLEHDRWLLTTSADPADPARALYARAGWVVLGPFGSGDVVLGRRARISGT